MTTADAAMPELLVDLTTTTHSQGRSAGATRVESRFGDALLRAHPDRVRAVSWSSTAERLMDVPADAALRYCTSSGVPMGDPPGTPLAAGPGGARTGDESRRRVLLVTGSGWLSNVAFLEGLLRARRDLGAELHVVIHDLVHAMFPHWTPQRDDSAKFRSHLEVMIANADRLLVYSRSTADDLAGIGRREGLRIPDVRRIALGNEFAGAAPPARPPSPEVAAIAAAPFVLYVSTVTHRKNHAFLCDVWARLAEELGPALPRLVLAGRVAPDQDATIERIARDPALRDHLVRATQITDADLAWLYAHCLFTVFPSLYEGWGLPVAESLAFGKVCLASNASAVPEAAAGLSPTLDPRDFRAWTDAIRLLARDHDARADAERRIRSSYRAVGWTEATARLLEAVCAPLPASADRTPRLCVGAGPAPVPADAHVLVREPWRPVRSPTGTIVAHETRLGLQLCETPPNGASFELAFDAAAPDAARVEIEVNGFVPDGTVLPATAPALVRRIDVPRDALRRRALVEFVVTAGPASGGVAAEPAWRAPLHLRDVAVTPLSADAERRLLGDQRVRWRLGDTLLFSAGSPSLPLLTGSWGDPAHWGVWTTAEAAGLRFRPMPQPSDPVRIRVGLRAFIWPAHPRLDVEVRAAGRVLTTWTFRHPVDLGLVERSVDVPADLLEDGLVRLDLTIPDCRSPRMLGLSDDDRRLGIGLVKAQCAPVAVAAADVDWLRRGRGGGAGW
ncbi:MAG: glycosyltransferase [Vicinamibacterales bacterium]